MLYIEDHTAWLTRLVFIISYAEPRSTVTFTISATPLMDLSFAASASTLYLVFQFSYKSIIEKDVVYSAKENPNRAAVVISWPNISRLNHQPHLSHLHHPAITYLSQRIAQLCIEYRPFLSVPTQFARLAFRIHQNLIPS